MIPQMLQVPAPLPESNDKLFRIAHKGAQETGESVDHHLFTMVTQEIELYALSTAYEQHSSGVYYRVFYPRSHITVPVFIRRGSSGGEPSGTGSDLFIEVDANEEMAASMALYVRMDQDDLGSHLADSPLDEEDGEEHVFYTDVKGGIGAGNDDDDGVMYTAVDVGGNDDDDGVMYTAVDVGGNDDDDGVMYTAVDVGDDNAQDEDGVMYTAVDLGDDNAQDEDGVMYTAVDLDGNGDGGDEDAGVMYTAVDMGGDNAEADADEFGGFDGLGSAVIRAASMKKPSKPSSSQSQARSRKQTQSKSSPNDTEEAPSSAGDPAPRGRGASSSKPSGDGRGRGRSSTQSAGNQHQSRGGGGGDNEARRRSATSSAASSGGGGGGKSARGAPRKERAATTTAAERSRGARSVSQSKARGGGGGGGPPVWLHEIDNRKDAEAKLESEGGEDGMFLVRPRDKTGTSHAFSVKLRGRFIHRLIIKRSDGSYKVDKQEDGWGTTLARVVEQVQDGMTKKHGIAFVPVLRPGAQAPLARKRSVYDGFNDGGDGDDISSI